jgi:hypothetical protein
MSHALKRTTTVEVRDTRLHEARCAWLTDHPELLKRLPEAGACPTLAESQALDEAVRTMSVRRLYAPQTASHNIRWSIRRLVSELRGHVVDPHAPGDRA